MKTTIGEPYIWHSKRGPWYARFRGHVFQVPGPDVTREQLRLLADRAEATMLDLYQQQARRQARGRKTYP